MGTRTIRTTVALPVDLLEAADHAIRRGRARNRNELLTMALRRELAAHKRAEIDAAFTAMADDADYLEESVRVAEEFAQADWEALQLGEQER